MREPSEKNELATPDVIEDDIRSQMPHILEILLIDRTTSSPKKNKTLSGRMTIIKNMIRFPIAATAQIRPELITARGANMIMPRALKTVCCAKKNARKQKLRYLPRHDS
jgi:hypothetical protein